MTISTNIAPYFDDYDETKKFLSILFRPGVAVQTRELTQLQTILQKQITRFGNHVFNDGAMVIPGQVSYDNEVGYVKLQNLNSGSQQISTFLSEFEGTIITGQTSGVRALVLKAVLTEGSDPHTLFVKYLDSGTSSGSKTLLDNEVIISDATTPRSATLNTLNATGKGSIASIQPGIYYIYGYFVLVDEQTIVLDKYSTNPSYRVGLQATETLVKPEDDLSLNDNAQGSFNYAAPGAHRYKIELTLDKLAVSSVLDQSFIELLRLEDGSIQYKVQQTDYSILEKTLARRTYDESGDYTVRPFNIQVREHRNNDRQQWITNTAYLIGDIVSNSGIYYTAKTSGTSGLTAPVHTSGDVSDGTVTWSFTEVPQYNRGVYTPAQGGDEAKLAVGLEPGKAYVQGYEIEKIATTFVAVPKARDFTRLNDTKVTTTMGNYILVSNVFSLPENITDLPLIDLYDQFTATGGTAAGTKVGTGRIRGIEKDASGSYKVSLFAVTMNTGKTFERNVKQLYYNNGGIFDFTADITPILTQLSGSITAAGSTAVVGVGTKFVSEVVIGDYISASGFVRRVTAVADDTHLTVDSVLTVSGVVFYGQSTEYKEPENLKLIFPLPKTAVRKLRSTDDVTIGTTYTIVRNLGTQTTNSSGTFSVNLITAGESFGSTAEDSNYLVIRNTDGSIATPTIVLGVGSTTATFSGLANSTAYTILAAINKSISSAKEKTKTLNIGSSVDFTTSATASQSTLSLGKADVYRIVKVQMATAFGAFSATGAVDVTSDYSFDSGQKLTHYDIGSVSLKPGLPKPTGTIRVTFDYFSHGTGDYFSVDSYSGSIQYKEINAILRDSLDFRPRIDDTGTTFTGTGASLVGMPKRGYDVEADFSYYLSRKDKIALDINGNFFDVEGVSAETPAEPADAKLSMVLHKLSLAPYTFNVNDVSIETLDNKRYTMRDIGSIEKRLDNVEYYTALSLLEQETKSLSILDPNGLDRYKNGFIVDSFEGHGVGNTVSPDYLCSVDMENKELRPFFNMSNVNLIEENTTPAQRATDGYTLTGDLITLPYTHQSLVTQPYASRTENVNPFAIFTFIGTSNLNPSSDEWFEVNRRPDIIINREGNFNTIQTLAEKSGVLGTVWNSWQTQWVGASAISNTKTVTRGFDSTDYGIGAGVWRNRNTFSPEDLALIGGDAVGAGARVITTQVSATQVGQSRSGVRTSVVAKVDTQVLEDRTLSTAVIPYIRSRNVLFLTRGLKPNTRFYPYFDDTSIAQYVTPATKISYSAITGFGSDFDYTTNVGGSASEATRMINGNADSSLNKGDVITGQTSGATAVVALQETTVAGVKALHVVNVKGTFTNGEVIIGSFTGARGTINAAVTTATAGGSLTTNFNGDLVGLFNIPNTDAIRFRTGVREFKLTDSTTNSIDFTSQSKQQYRAQGILETKQSTILATRNAEIVQEVVNQTQTITQTSTRTVGDTGWYDPLAQTFLVQQRGGAFITKVDVFFATKDSGIPVQLELREVVNGYPGKRVLPFSRTIKTPDKITTSTDASVATTFTFDSPVYVQDATEYCVVLLSDSNNYNVWISQIGEKAVGTDRFISEQPYAGVLFKSQNASTWTADQLQDLKFTIHRAKFTTGTVGTAAFVNDVLPLDVLEDSPFQTTFGSNKVRVFHQNHGMTDGSTVTIGGVTFGSFNNIPSTELNGNHVISNADFDSYVITTTTIANASGYTGGEGLTATINRRYDTLHPIIQNQTFSDTILTVDAKTVTTNYSVDTTNTSLIANETAIMSDAKTIASKVNETAYLSGAKSLTINAYLYSDNDSVSPIIDTHRLSVVTVNNRIDTPTTSLNVNPIDLRTIASAVTTIAIDGTNERLTTTNTTVKAAFLTVSVGKYLTITGAANSNNNGTFLVTEVATDGSYITLSNNMTTEASPTLTVVSNEKYVNEIAPLNSSSSSKYVTRTINLQNPSTYFKVLFGLNKPQNATISVYYKTVPVGSATPIEQLKWVEATPDASLVSTSNPTNFIDTQFSVNGLAAFSSIAIKVVMNSTTTSAIPRIKDFRVIACA
jgi:hypothetical protein